MLQDAISRLSAALFEYQRQSEAPNTDNKLGLALENVLARQVRPVLTRRLRPTDVDDVLSEIKLAFWRYRMSIRAEEVGRFIHAIAHRKLADQLRQYYKDAAHNVGNPETDAGSLLDVLPTAGSASGVDADQQAWEMLNASELPDTDLLVAYFLFLGTPKGEIASALGISPNTVTNALKRCRESLISSRQRSAGGSV